MESLRDLIEKAVGGYGMRHDGKSPKGQGFFGPVSNEADGGVSTELSGDETVEGQNLSFPLMTPNQSFKDMSGLMTGNSPSDAMYQKAILHALSRKLTGRNPFAGEGEATGYPVNTAREHQ